jgi:hypothetical protein
MGSHKSVFTPENNPIEQRLKLLRAWASIGAQLRASRSFATAAGWSAARRIMDAVRPILAGEAKRLKNLLAKSRKNLAPLEDPFDVDLGLHRWLGAEREEAYSDWLAWVIQQARTPGRVFKLFGLQPPPDSSLERQRAEVQRESCVPYGHVEREGRLDLVIRFGDRAMIVVEVKKGESEQADTTKQAGYTRWLKKQDCPHKKSILLATAGEEETYEGFSFLSWADLCVEMRLLGMALKEDSRLAAAMVLAFVAAVEQNLLGFSAGLVRKICQGQVGFFNPRIVDHIEMFLKKSEE